MLDQQYFTDPSCLNKQVRIE